MNIDAHGIDPDDIKPLSDGGSLVPTPGIRDDIHYSTVWTLHVASVIWNLVHTYFAGEHCKTNFYPVS
jgi:hypothetical protein